MKSKMEMERVRGPDGKLTNWVTGARTVWIEVPKEKIEQRIDCGVFKASIFYRELLEDMECRNCLKKGHKASNCKEPERCRRCRKVGHKMAECVEAMNGEDIGSNAKKESERKGDWRNQIEEMVKENRKEKNLKEKHDERSTEEMVVQAECYEMERKEKEGIEEEREEGRKEGITSDIQKNMSDGKSHRNKRVSEKGGKKGKVVKEMDMTSSEGEQEDSKMKDKKKQNRKNSNRESKGKKSLTESSCNSETEDERKKLDNNITNRGRPVMKEMNTLDRFFSRSGSRKRSKTPEEDVKNQRAKLDKDVN